MLVPIIGRQRCLPQAHRDSASTNTLMRDLAGVSEREKAGAFPPPPCEGRVHGIGHQVKPGWWVAGRPGR